MTDFWRGRRVFITGHTGFMGGWLSSLLLKKGAEVHGYGLEPPTEPSFYEATGLERCLTSSAIGDVRDEERLRKALGAVQPQVVFHLAAQPLVRVAHVEPVETFSTNVMGTANLLEALRNQQHLDAALIVTTDKVYRNENRALPYVETDQLGGREPYSASKAATEFVASAWLNSYFQPRGVGLATIRAGNIFGGGDWAADRLVPDAARAFAAGRPLVLRHPDSTRPWQHVLEPLPGYLKLAERLAAAPEEFSSGWNFGPRPCDCRPVGELAQRLAHAWGDTATVKMRPPDQIFEERLLALDSSKANERLGWAPKWSLDLALVKTAAWYKAFYAGADMEQVTNQQIALFEAAGNGPQ